MKTTTLSLLLFFLIQFSHAQVQYKIMPDASKVTFTGSGFWMFDVEGSINIEEGHLKFNTNLLNKPEVYVKLNAASLNTGNDQRDSHLKSDDFLFVEEYPHIIFKATDIQKSSKGDNQYVLTGNLTIRGKTNTEKVNFTFTGYSNEQSKMTFKGSATIDRFDYGVDFRGMPVSEEVEIKFTVTAKKQ